MSLEGKTAIVTGGARGIGRAICIALAKAGANVVTCYARSAEACEETIRMVEECGVKGMCVKADVSNLEEITAMVDTVKKEFGTIDILVNNAGITKDNLIMGVSEEDFDAVIDTNLKGAFLFTKALSRTMLKQKGGRIINISSIVGVRGNAGQTNYAASKAGLIGLTKSVAKEYGRKNIRCNAIAPGYITTDMTAALSETQTEEIKSEIPMGKLGSPEDVARLALFLGSEMSSYITGEVIKVDGGMYV